MPPPQITLYHRGFVRERKLSARPDWRARPLTKFVDIALGAGGREAARTCMLEACATERDLARPCDLSFSKVLTYYPHDTASDPAVRHGSPPHCLWKAFGEFAVRPGSGRGTRQIGRGCSRRDRTFRGVGGGAGCGAGRTDPGVAQIQLRTPPPAKDV